MLVVIVDSLRADAVYDGWIRTPNIDALARRGPALHQGVSGGDAHRPGAQLHPERAARVSLPGLARLPGTHPETRLVAPAQRGAGAAERAGPGRLLDRIRDRQPVPGLLAALRAAAPQRASLRAHRGPDRWAEAGLERAEADPQPLVASRELRRQDASAGGLLPGQQPLLGGSPEYLRRPRLPQRHERARRCGQAAAVRSHRRHLRAARALDPAAEVPEDVRRSRLARARARDAALRAGQQLAGFRRARRRTRAHPRPLRRRR